MSPNDDKKKAIQKLQNYRDQINDSLIQIETLLKVFFPDEFSIAYQHWLPQIKTALKDDTKWLPRGQYSMDYTLNRIVDQIEDGSLDKGVSKYIK
jgi:hypothetical protein